MKEVNENNRILEDDHEIYMPFEEVKTIEQIYDKMKRARDEFQKIGEEINLINNNQ
jgi:hypothetical protein